MCVYVCVYVFVCVSVYVCVCEREREREREADLGAGVEADSGVVGQEHLALEEEDVVQRQVLVAPARLQGYLAHKKEPATLGLP